MLKIWDLAKKSHFTSVLTTDAAYANFHHTMMNYIENGIHHQFLKKNVDKILTRQRQLLLNGGGPCSQPCCGIGVEFFLLAANSTLKMGAKSDIHL